MPTIEESAEGGGLVDALARSEERYRFLSESIPVQIWTATPDGKLDYVSEQTARRLGSTPSQVLAEGWKKFVHPEDLPRAVERWLHSLQTGENYEVEFRLTVAGGGYAWHLARAVPRRGPTGGIVQWFGTNTDIEAQRRQQDHVHELLDEVAQQATRLSEQNQLLALETDIGVALAQNGTLKEALTACASLVVTHLDAGVAHIWTVDDAGGFLELRARAGSRAPPDGPPGRVPIGRYEIGRIAAERRPHVTHQVANDPHLGDPTWAVREGTVAFAGYPLLIGEKLVGVIAAFARHPLSLAALTALGSVANGLAQAIERRRAEEAIRISEQWLSTTLASIGDGVITTNAEGHVTFLNAVAAALCEWTVAEAMGQPVGLVFSTVDASTGEPVETRTSRAPLGPASESVTRCLLRRRSGTDVWVEVSAAPIRDGLGVLSGAVLVLRDATEKTRIDAERVHLLAEAQEGRAEAEKQKRTAELASHAKDEFLATASHELRTPLNAILGWARLMGSDKLDAPGFARGVATIERNAKAQVRLIEDILDGSRIITGNLHLEMRSVDLASAVQAAVDAVRPAASAKEIRVDVVLDSKSTRLKGDPDRLQQVVWNLVNNAIKFTPKGGDVEIRVARVGTHIELSVKDSGQGIPRDFLPHVFERFRQVDGSTTRRHGGLGLGLALVRYLIEAHGGTVRAESCGEGQGAVFTALLPVQAVVERADEEVRASAAGSPAFDRESPASSLYGVGVLVIDDEPDARELVATVLRGHGARVFVAASVEQALEFLVVHSPSVLVSDIGMPATDGYELIRRVRAVAPRIPAIALTAYAREADRRRALGAGFQTYLAKPVEPEALAWAVGELAHSSTAAASS